MTTLTKIATAMEASSTNNHPNTINDIDQRHHKLLQNIVKILKINNVLEEYRLVVRNIQQQCCCKRTKSTWDRLNILESKYKELIVESCRSSGSVGRSSSNTQMNNINNNNSNNINNNNNNNNNTNNSNNANNNSNNNNINEDYMDLHHRNQQHIGNESNEIANKKIKLRSPMKIIPINNDNNVSSKEAHHHHHGSNGQSTTLDHNKSNDPTANLITSFMVIDDNDEVNLIEEEEILEDEEDDDAEEELDIEEYMALSEILEKESGQNKFEKEVDSKNELILVIRDVNTKEVICYECTVGGTCGFLSRERTRMLLHIGKHFQQNAEDEEDEDEDEDEDEEVHSIQNRIHSGNNVDISIIPVNADPIASAASNSNSNSDSLMLFKDELSNIKSKCHQQIGNISSPTSKLFNQQRLTLMNQQTKITAQTASTTILASRVSYTANNNINNQMKQQQQASNKPIKCDWENCTFMCDQNYKLRTHIRQVHEKVRPYLCDWPGCFGAYKTRSNLASHRMVHTGERPFICDHPRCGAKFARKYDCERHRRIHSEKMYACEWPGCGKRLCDPYNLERHMMVHKGELPFRCPIVNCVRGFRELRYLRDHMVNSHKFLPDTNQLRMACSNSSKMVSIIGYNLNESGGVATSNDSNSVGSTSTNANDHVVATSFVAAIVTKSSNSILTNNQNKQPVSSEMVAKKEPAITTGSKKSTGEQQQQGLGQQSSVPQRTISTRSTSLKMIESNNNNNNTSNTSSNHSIVSTTATSEDTTDDDDDTEQDEDSPSPPPAPPQSTRTNKRIKRSRN